MPEPLIEICVEGVDGALAAEQGGADRIELCASLLEGGITPSIGVVREALARVRIRMHAIVRPRGGDFLYSAAEYASMLDDVVAIRDCRAGGRSIGGVVVGCLNPDGTIDEARMVGLVRAARPMTLTCHRAFDMTADPDAALEALIRCGVDRVLTSGLRRTAVEGIPVLRRLVERAGDRIVIMGCGELRPDTIGRVRRETGLCEMHFSAPSRFPSGMTFRNAALAMGGTDPEREYMHTLTDPDLVRATIAAARA